MGNLEMKQNQAADKENVSVGNLSADEKQATEWKKEEKHLEDCEKVIQNNIDRYSEELRKISAETKELYDNYRSDNPELHNELVIGLDMKAQTERVLQKNLKAYKKPYFGRIDYYEKDDNLKFSLYIGKNGILRNRIESMITDWRAPVSSVYYESEIGDGSYKTPFGEKVDITLDLKRTYEITNGKLIDFFDSNVVTNDEFLTKYLSKNKEVVLGEIIATIQKEQNEIIRDTPFHSVIVQGVAGSGKTTVAMHRISYLLYNFKDKLQPDEFYIIGSNKMLLNYITGVLPNLDVYNVNHMTMEEFFLTLLDRDFNIKKGKYVLSNSFLKLTPENENGNSTSEIKSYKGSLQYIKALEYFLKQYEQQNIVTEPVEYKGEIIYTKEEILYYLNFFEEKPLQEKIDLLNKQLVYRIASVNEQEQQRKEVTSAETKRFKNYFGVRNGKLYLMEVYLEFLNDLKQHQENYTGQGLYVPGADKVNMILQDLLQKKVDIYDLGMLTLIKKRQKLTKDFEYISHIVIDEAQDFGVIIFYILKKLFKNCTYTIMGDVSQNIYYDTGMNDWEVMKNDVFQPLKDKFYVLAKSYRNTIEISDFASRILKKCSFKTYDIEPIIRHGKEVEVYQAADEKEMAAITVTTIKGILKEGYDTIAVICRTVEETRKVQELLEPHVPVVCYGEEMEKMTFTSGVMVLPIHMTKGLEFDAVIIWNPDSRSYQANDADAKLLYVAATRAMQELHIIYNGELSELLKQKCT